MQKTSHIPRVIPINAPKVITPFFPQIPHSKVAKVLSVRFGAVNIGRLDNKKTKESNKEIAHTSPITRHNHATITNALKTNSFPRIRDVSIWDNKTVNRISYE
jgi:hypothetical protein